MNTEILPSLVPDSLIIPAEIMDSILAEPPKVPNAFIVGLSYTSSRNGGAELSSDDLANVAVGIQDAALSTGAVIKAVPKEPMLNADANKQEDASIADKTEAIEIANKINKKSAKNLATDAAARRVSRRLLLAERSKKLTVVCPITGVVSLLEVPAVPGKALIWTSPLADLGNCRGMAQQGSRYLEKLDTQTLAGILIILADAYHLFRYQPFDTGAQKNAILRTAGKDRLIKMIILIENFVHSENCKYLPPLSLVFDSITEREGAELKIHNYLGILAAAAVEPDKTLWDANRVKPQYPIRPVYIKDVEKAAKKVSFLAKQEKIDAKKQYVIDKKEGKLLVSKFVQTTVVPARIKGILNSLFVEDGLLMVPDMVLGNLIEKLTTEFPENEAVAGIIQILKHDRRRITLNLDELAEVEETEQDDPAPGNEEAIEDDTEYEVNEITGSVNGQLQDYTILDKPVEEEPETNLVPPAGLSTVNRILWLKKMKAAQAKERTFVTSNLPSSVTYVPGADKERMGKE